MSELPVEAGAASTSYQRPSDDPDIALVSPEEAAKHERLYGHEYHELASNGKAVMKDIFYRVVHVYPKLFSGRNWTSLGTENGQPKVVVERFRKRPGPNAGEFIRIPEPRIGHKSAEFHMDAKDFLDKYRIVENE